MIGEEDHLTAEFMADRVQNSPLKKDTGNSMILKALFFVHNRRATPDVLGER
jgi:hypothetical protein